MADTLPPSVPECLPYKPVVVVNFLSSLAICPGFAPELLFVPYSSARTYLDLEGVAQFFLQKVLHLSM